MERAQFVGVLIIISVVFFFVYNAREPLPKQNAPRKNPENIPKDNAATTSKPLATNKDNGRSGEATVPVVPELPKEDKPRFRPVYFESTGRKYVGATGMGCDDASQLTTMTDASVEACEAMCAADSQCGAFTLDSGRLCSTYMICYTKEAPERTNLFIRE